MAQLEGDDEAYEDRLVILEDLGIEENALEHDEFTDEVSASTDEAAVRRFFARAFQEWANGNVEGTAQEIFDAVVLSLIATNKENARVRSCEQYRPARTLGSACAMPNFRF